MKKLTGVLVLMLIFGSNSVFSQKLVKTSSIQAGFFDLGYAREFPVSNKTVINVFGGMYGGFFYNSFEGAQFDLVPVVSVEPRLYYNMAKRLSKNKKIDFNSVNYVALNCAYVFGMLSTNPYFLTESTFSVSPEWGFRRYLGKRFTFDLAIGPGFNKSLFEPLNVSVNVYITFSYHLKTRVSEPTN